jgi:NAD+ kinase
MNVAICSKIERKRIEEILSKSGFKIVNKNPEFILCYGGDGTILFSERKFPSIPKLIVKDVKTSRICRKYDVPSTKIKAVLQKIKLKKFRIIEEMKLEAKIKKKKLVALNEIQVHNKLPTRAIRFSLKVNGKYFDDLIGDGVIIATPFGSTAYYSSVGGRKFKKGIGIAFNNLYMRKIRSFVVPENSKVIVKIKRGPALLLADNYEKFIELREGSKVVIKKSKEKAKFIDVIFK